MQTESAQMDLIQTVAEEVTDEEITERIVRLKLDAGAAILEIGRWLTVMKGRHPHGEWLTWLSEKIDFSERIAQQYMKLYDGFSQNPNALSDLGKTKALKLLSLPPAEREAFTEAHDVAGMSTRELDQAIRERDEARRNEEAAKKTVTAVSELAKKEREEARLALEAAEQRAERAEAEAAAAQESAAAVSDSLRLSNDLNKNLEARVRELENAPKDVYRDEKAIREAAEDARNATAVEWAEKVKAARDEEKAEWSAKVREVEEKLAKAEEKAKRAAAKAKSAGEPAEKQTAAELAEARRESERLRAELEAAKKEQARTALEGDADLAAFKIIFDQAQADVNKLRGLLLKVRSREDQELAGKLANALLALADAVRGCAA